MLDETAGHCMCKSLKCAILVVLGGRGENIQGAQGGGGDKIPPLLSYLQNELQIFQISLSSFMKLYITFGDTKSLGVNVSVLSILNVVS